MTDVIFRLPVSTQCVVLGIWVDISALIRLTLATRGCPERTMHMTEVLSSKSLTFTNPVEATDNKLISWFVKHKVKLSSLVFKSVCGETAEIIRYLRQLGQSVRKVGIQANQSDRIMMTIATYCRNLTKFRALDVDVNSTLTDILLNNPSLVEIELSEVKCQAEGVFDGLTFNNLRTLSVSTGDGISGYPWSESAFSDSLLYAELGSTCMYVGDTAALVRNCPRLKAISLHSAHRDDSHINRILATCPNLFHLDFFHNNGVTDNGILQIVSIMTQLRSINCQCCALLTSKSLLHLAAHRGSTLEEVHVSIADFDKSETQLHFQAFCEQMTVLRTLCIHGKNEDLCSTDAAFAIVNGCPALQTLILHEVTIGTSGRRFIQKIRPELKILDHNENNQYSILKMAV